MAATVGFGFGGRANVELSVEAQTLNAAFERGGGMIFRSPGTWRILGVVVWSEDYGNDATVAGDGGGERWSDANAWAGAGIQVNPS